MHTPEPLKFLTNPIISEVINKFGTPAFVFDENILKQQLNKVLSLPAPYGLTVRYAMKANPHRQILELFYKSGLKIDASSGYEVLRAMNAGVLPTDISLAAQELPKDFANLIKLGVRINACSLNQLELIGRQCPGARIGVRINPGIGSGHSIMTNVGGVTSSFGVWHSYIPKIKEIAEKYKLKIICVHTHIGAGVDLKIWEEALQITINFVNDFPDATCVDIGGGFKIARINTEKEVDFAAVGQALSSKLIDFANKTGRKLHLEIEPGTSLVANAASLITTIHDIVDTGADGHEFLKINAGMNDFLRAMLYGAQHTIVVVNNLPSKVKNYIVVGHCCESGDMLTPVASQPGHIEPRALQQAQIGDVLVLEGVGAYVYSLCARGFNSFPASPLVMLKQDGSLKLMNRRETLQDLVAAER